MEKQIVAQALLAQAEERLIAGEYQEAISRFTQSFRVHANIKAKYGVMICYYNMKNYPNAILSAKESLDLVKNLSDQQVKDKYYEKIALCMGKALERLGNLEEAYCALAEITQYISLSNLLVQEKILRLNIEKNSLEEYKTLNFIIKNYIEKPGNLSYLISKDWFDKWTDFSTHKSIDPPGPISNASIISLPDPDKFYYDTDPNSYYTNICIKNALYEDQEYVAIPKDAYFILSSTWNIADNEIPRYSIGISDDFITEVEVYLKEIDILILPKITSKEIPIKTICISRRATVNDLRIKLHRVLRDLLLSECLCFEISRLWKVPRIEITDKEFPTNTDEIYIKDSVLLNDQTELEFSDIDARDVVIIEFLTLSGKWTLTNTPSEVCINCKKTGNLTACPGCLVVKYCSIQCQEENYQWHKDLCDQIKSSNQSAEPIRLGMTGLQNLGNTCYMNSAIQCLSHTISLTSYFLNGDFMQSINQASNKRIHLVFSYAGLLKDLWIGTSAIVSPWQFKGTISRLAPQFMGYQQHDSHELITYILNGLHEDLNKAAISNEQNEIIETAKTEEELALKSWERFLLKNQSFIVDNFYGQSKSMLICPECNFQSIRYDPFLTFSLSIPNFEVKKIRVVIVFSNPDKIPIVQNFAVNIDSKINVLKSLIKQFFDISHIMLAAYTNFTLKGFVSDTATIFDIGDKNIIAFEMPENMSDVETIPLVITKTPENKPFSTKSLQTFMRLIFLSRSYTALEIHIILAYYFKSIIEENTGKKLDDGIDALNKFNEMTDPIYLIKIVNQSSNPEKTNCEFCGTKNCKNCVLPQNNEITLREMLNHRRNSKNHFILEIEWNSIVLGLEKLNTSKEFPNIIQEPNLKQASEISLYDCWKFSSESEKLDDKNRWLCPKCQKSVQATKSFHIHKAPKILIIHLIRFKSRSSWSEKINSTVNFPIEGLSLNEFVGENNEAVYDLYAISNHYGSMVGGHYTAYVKSPRGNSWIDMDDSYYFPIKQENLVTPAAYILFYQRRDP
ncbi:unnamed protein product [Blepharisma stoltei]|uniref:ubiquitinyl hydrolase 1 n=1 Tax=Blepharisma stoltei TaxID=1481888 RepID=A0AAU9K424_9CILI|nr:unnamed protein product [Blepharisma stoltei]